MARSFLKPLYARDAALGAVGRIGLEPHRAGQRTFHRWLAADVSKERLRSIDRSTRITEGLSRWPLSWLDRPGVVCYPEFQSSV